MSLVFTRSALLARAWFVALMLSAAVVAAAALALFHLRQDVVLAQRRELELLADALGNETDRGLQGIEEGLEAVRTELQEGRFPLAAGQAPRALATRAELMPLVDSLWLVDEQWRVLAQSDASALPPMSVFPARLGASRRAAMAIGAPYQPTAPEPARVAMALRVDGPGVLRGWVVAAVPQSAFFGGRIGNDSHDGTRVAIFRADGLRLAGRLSAASAPGEPIVEARLADWPHAGVRRFDDGRKRLVGVRATPHFGVRVVLARDFDDALADWRYTAILTSVGLVVLVLIIVGAVVLLQRAARRSLETQAALQAQLARAGRLESLGTLAGGVAHDFNNVLAAIIGFGELAQDGAAPQGAQARHLDRLLQAALRGKALVERILQFSRGGARESVVFELASVVDEVLAMLWASLPPGVVLESDLDAGAGANVRGDPTQAFEAVMNLCTNALQAMPGGGMLAVGLARRTVLEPRVLSHDRLPAGRYVALGIADEGPGITTEVMDRLFEPFFTTKGPRQGTGLGLAVVHGVVAEFGGAIDVESRPGAGTRFTVFLPECDAAATTVPAIPLERIPLGSGQKLLVVDDEPALLALAQEMLRGLGYEPLCFASPAGLLAALREEPGAFAGVITDEVMPEMTGTQLSDAIRAIAPDLPVLLVSGYGGAALAARARAAGVAMVLGKPLQRAMLARALYELIDS